MVEQFGFVSNNCEATLEDITALLWSKEELKLAISILLLPLNAINMQTVIEKPKQNYIISIASFQ
jgi:hypothetical protein